MTAINALMSELIDFAGLFPPASLDMGATVRGFAAYRECASSDALGRLIVPVSRFDEFEAECVGLMPRVPDLDGNEEDPDPWAISALMSPANDLDAVAADLAAIEAFNEQNYRGAVDLLKKAIKLDPDNHIFYSNRAAAYMAMEKFDKALKTNSAAFLATLSGVVGTLSIV